MYQGGNKGLTKSEDLSVVSCAINKTTELLLRKQFVGGMYHSRNTMSVFKGDLKKIM